MSYREGQTATNPSTGQTIVFRGGQWVNATPPNSSGGGFRRLSPTDANYIRDQREAAQKAAGAVRSVDRFMQENQRAGTGQLRSVPVIGDVLNAFSAPHQTMEGLTEGMLPGMRVPGSGTFTDADAVSARKAVPNVRTLGPANTQRADFIRQNAQSYNDYVTFLEDWAQQRGTLLGAEAAWNARRQQPRQQRNQQPRNTQPSRGGATRERTYNPATGRLE